MTTEEYTEKEFVIDEAYLEKDAMGRLETRFKEDQREAMRKAAEEAAIEAIKKARLSEPEENEGPVKIPKEKYMYGIAVVLAGLAFIGGSILIGKLF